MAGLSLLAWKKGQRVLLLTQLCDIAIADKGSIRVPPPLLKGQAEEQPIESSIPPDGIAAAKRAERRRDWVRESRNGVWLLDPYLGMYRVLEGQALL